MKIFELTDEQWHRFKAWEAKIEREHPSDVGAIGGRFSISFTFTSIGTAVKARAAMPFGGEIVMDLSDYESW